LLERLKPWSVKLYCTDDSYDTLLPVGRHYIGKDETVAIERVNSRLRHWFARFRRRTCVVSKALEMVDATSLPPTTSIEQRQNSPCHYFLNTLGN
jgi:insertion element IS1 protein InsB